jgi:hypothetical protein
VQTLIRVKKHTPTKEEMLTPDREEMHTPNREEIPTLCVESKKKCSKCLHSLENEIQFKGEKMHTQMRKEIPTYTIREEMHLKRAADMQQAA